MAVASPARPLPPSATAEAQRRRDAASVLRAYGARHALGEPRQPPSDAELVAAALADPIDPAIAPERWRTLDAAWRLNEAYDLSQHDAWTSACHAGVAAWWQSARQIDDELAVRLAAGIPADFYAGMRVWNQHAAWLRQRQEADPVFRSIPLANVGPAFTLFVAQNAWARSWAEHDHPLERAISERARLPNAWALDTLEVEQARFCTAAYADGVRTWPPPGWLRVLEPAVAATVAPPATESGTLAEIRDRGTTWLVTRRDWTTTIEQVPPCKRVRRTCRDCTMQEGGGWIDVCREHRIRRFEDHRFVLHFDAAPANVHPGDAVSFYFDRATAHAVLVYASRRADVPPYFALGD